MTQHRALKEGEGINPGMYLKAPPRALADLAEHCTLVHSNASALVEHLAAISRGEVTYDQIKQSTGQVRQTIREAAIKKIEENWPDWDEGSKLSASDFV